MPLKDRISTMLHIRTGSVSSPSDHMSAPQLQQPTTSGTSPPQTPASTNTNSTACTEPLSSPNTMSTSLNGKTSPNSFPSTRNNSNASPEDANIISPQTTKTFRLASRLSTIPKRMMRHKHTISHSSTLSAFPAPPSNQKSGYGAGQQAHNQNPRGPGTGKHKYTKSAFTGTAPVTSAPSVVHPQPQRPITYHQESNVSPFLYGAQSEFQGGPHPGQPYNPFAQPPSPPAPPQPKSETDCWEDDPPHVRRRLENRYWEVLFGDYNWERASRKKFRESATRGEWEGISPRSNSPDRPEDMQKQDSFWMKEPVERGRQRLRTPTWVDREKGNGLSADVIQARELAEKLARVRMKRNP